MQKLFKIYVSRVSYGYSLTYSISPNETNPNCSLKVLNRGAPIEDRIELMRSIRFHIMTLLKEAGATTFRIVFNRHFEINGSVGPGNSTSRQPIKKRDVKLFLEALQLPLE